jgi:hypothetical protein
MNITRDSCVGFLVRLPNCREVTLENRQRNLVRRLAAAEARHLADFEGSIGVPCNPQSDKIQLVAIMDVTQIRLQMMALADPGSAVAVGISRLEDVFHTEEKYQEIFGGFVDQWVTVANVSTSDQVLDLQYATVKAHPASSTDKSTPSLYLLFLLLILPCSCCCFLCFCRKRKYTIEAQAATAEDEIPVAEADKVATAGTVEAIIADNDVEAGRNGISAPEVEVDKQADAPRPPSHEVAASVTVASPLATQTLLAADDPGQEGADPEPRDTPQV